MPDVKFGIDSSGAAQQANTYIEQLKRIAAEAKKVQQALNSVGGGGAGAQQQARNNQQLVQSNQQLARTTQQVAREEAARERVRVRQLNAAAAHLRTLGAEEAAYARNLITQRRLAVAYGQSANTAGLLAAAQARITQTTNAAIAATAAQTAAQVRFRAALAGSLGTMAQMGAATVALGRSLRAVGAGAAASAARIQQSFDDARQSITNRWGRALTRSLTLPFVLASAAALKMELDFRRSFTRIITLAEETTEGAAILRKEVLALAPAVGIGPNELARALYNIESVGYAGAEAMDILEKSAKAAAVGLGDTGQVAKTVVAALQAWGDAGLTAAQATDQLITAVQLGGAEADAFSNTLGRVIALAREAGATFAQATAFIATFTRFGVPASEAVTALRQSFSLFIRVPTQQTEEALAKLGLTVEKARELLAERGLAGAYVELIKRTREYGVEAGALIPNIRALAGVLATAGSQADAYLKIEEKIINSTGKLASAFRITQQSGVLVYGQLKAAAEAASILLVEQTGLAGAVTGAAESFTKLIQAFNDLSPATKSLIGSIVAFGAALGPTVLLLGGLGRVLRNVVTPAFIGAGPPILRIITALSLGAITIGSFSGAWDGMQKTLRARQDMEKAGTDLEKVDEAAADAADGASKFGRSLAALSPVVTGLVIGSIAGPYGTIAGGILGAMWAMLVGIRDTAPSTASAVAALQSTWEALQGSLPTHFGKIGPALSPEVLAAQRAQFSSELDTLRVDLVRLRRRKKEVEDQLAVDAAGAAASGYRQPESIFIEDELARINKEIKNSSALYQIYEARLIDIRKAHEFYDRQLRESNATAEEREKLDLMINTYAGLKSAVNESVRYLGGQAGAAQISREAFNEYNKASEKAKFIIEAVNEAFEEGVRGKLLTQYAIDVAEAADQMEIFKEKIAKFQAQWEATDALEQIQFETGWIERHARATLADAEALRQFEIERAVAMKARELEIIQRETENALSQELIDNILAATRAQAEANASLSAANDFVNQQKKAATDIEEIWSNTVENIQREFGNLFTNVILQGKDAFDDLGELLKQMFARVVGELVTANVFGPLFESLQSGTAQGARALPTGSQNSSLIQFGKVLEESFGNALSGLRGLVTNNTSVVIADGTRITRFYTAPAPTGAALLGNPQKALSGVGASSGGLGSVFGGALTGAALGGGLAGLVGANKGGQIGGLLGGALAGGLLYSSAGYSALTAAGTGGSALSGALGASGAVGAGLGALGVVGGGIALGAGIYGLLNGTETPGKSALQTAGGGLLMLGAVIPVIGWILAIVGAILLLVSLFIKGPRHAIGIGTAPTLEALQAQGLEGGFDYLYKETPFGFIGALGAETSSNMRRQIEGALNSVKYIDNQIARVLTDSDITKVREYGLPQLGVSNPKRMTQKLTGQRLGHILRALGIPAETIGGLSTLTLDDPDKQIAEVTGLLKTRSDILQILEELRGTYVAATDTAKALKEVSRSLDDIELAAPALGILIDDLDELRIVAAQKITDAFNKSIADSIAAVADPATLALAQLAETQEKRLAEAADASADLVEVERLAGIERVQLLRQLNAPIQDTINAIKLSPSGSSPTFAIQEAQNRFFDIATGLQDKTGEFQTQDLAAAAQSLLGLGEQFLGAPSFAQQREEILGILESFLVELAPVGSDSVDQLQNLNLETARGNAISEQQLTVLIDQTISMKAEISLLRAQLDRLLAA